MRTDGVNQVFRFDEDIRLHRKSRKTRFFPANIYLLDTFATSSELPSYIIPWQAHLERGMAMRPQPTPLVTKVFHPFGSFSLTWYMPDIPKPDQWERGVIDNLRREKNIQNIVGIISVG